MQFMTTPVYNLFIIWNVNEFNDIINKYVTPVYNLFIIWNVNLGYVKANDVSFVGL